MQSACLHRSKLFSSDELEHHTEKLWKYLVLRAAVGFLALAIWDLLGLGLDFMFCKSGSQDPSSQKTFKCSPENPTQRAFLCQAGICRWEWLSACANRLISSRGFLIPASGSPMPGRLERGQEEGRGLPLGRGGWSLWSMAPSRKRGRSSWSHPARLWRGDGGGCGLRGQQGQEQSAHQAAGGEPAEGFDSSSDWRRLSSLQSCPGQAAAEVSGQEPGDQAFIPSSAAVSRAALGTLVSLPPKSVAH